MIPITTYLNENETVFLMADLKKPSVKSKVEAVIFSTGRKMAVEEISRLCRSLKQDVLLCLQELQKEYDEKQSSLMLVEEGEFWKFAVRDHLIPIVRKIVTETELSRTMMETLAVIAFKYPILQSDLIKLRTNKAYDHLAELEKAGYISRQKHGRTNLIKLTEKFFKYFDLTEEKLKDQLKDFDTIAKAIKEKEEEVDKIKEDQKKKAEDLKQQDDKIRKEIESLDLAGEEFNVPLETYEEKKKEGLSEEFVQQDNLILEKEKIGELEVVEGHTEKIHTKKEIKHSETQPAQIHNTGSQEIKETQQTETEKKDIFEKKDFHKEQIPHIKKEKRGIKMTPEMEIKVNQKVEEMIRGGPENKEEKKENDENGKIQ